MASGDIGHTISALREELSVFAEREKELAAAELKPAAKHAGFGAGYVAGAAVFVVHALWMLVIAIALFVCWLLTTIFNLSLTAGLVWGFAVSAVFSVLVAALLVKLGMNRFKKVKKPEATIAEAKATLNTLVDSFLQPEETTVAVANMTPSTVSTTDEHPFSRP
ncbi:MAG: phage holin family protein [Tessaracoccus sp.]